jgi:hypothetical protein
MKFVQFAVLAFASLIATGPSLAASTPAELDDLTIITATPRDASVKPVVETAKREAPRPETSKAESGESHPKATVGH